jgi:hypothetical protein
LVVLFLVVVVVVVFQLVGAVGRVSALGSRSVAGLTAALTAVAAVLALGLGIAHTSWTLVTAMSCVVLVSETRLLHLAFGQQRWSFAWSELPIGAALMWSTSAGLVAGVLTAVVVAQLLRRQPLLKIAFNAAQFAAATAVAATVTRVVGPGPGGACLGMVAFFIVNSGSVAVVLSATTGDSFGSMVRHALPLTAVPFSANAALGLLGGWVTTFHLAALVLVLPPLVALWSSQVDRARRTAEAVALRDLAGADAAALRSTDHVGETSVRLAVGALGDAEAELVLLTADGLLRFRGGHGDVRRESVSAEVLDAPQLALTLARGKARGVDQTGQPWAGVAITDGAMARGVLVVHRVATADRFSRADTDMLAQLGSRVAERVRRLETETQLAQAVQEAGSTSRVLSELGAETAPVLVSLRDSARRLMQTADRTAPAPDDLVRELECVESAVAALFGALAAAAAGAGAVRDNDRFVA